MSDEILKHLEFITQCGLVSQTLDVLFYKEHNINFLLTKYKIHS